MSNRAPIGIFDSGVGGLTVLKALRECLPGEAFVYLGDTARLPYGTKSAVTVQRYALNAGAHLERQGVKLLVIACNTASSYALAELRAAAAVPVIGVVEPGVRSALATGSRRIGVIGTEGTIRSKSYQSAIERLSPEAEICAAACPLLVPLAEEGWGDHAITDQVATHYLTPLIEWGVETLILGCTHYPLLRPSLSRVVGPDVTLVDSASAVADAVLDHPGTQLNRDHHERGGVAIQLTDASDRFLHVASAILGSLPQHPDVVNINQSTIDIRRAHANRRP